MKAILLPDLARHPLVRQLTDDLGPAFQAQAMQCLLSRDPLRGFSLAGPEREIPVVARVARLHAAGLPRMALSQLLARCRRAYRHPEFVQATRDLGLDLLAATPVLLACRDRLIDRCRRSLPDLAAFAAGLAIEPASGPSPVDHRSLSLTLRSITCREDAHPDWPGMDEIQVSLFLTDDHGRAGKRVASYQGDLGPGRGWHPERLMQVFELDDDYEEPKVITATLLLGEIDLSTFANVLEEIHEDIRRELISLLLEAARLEAVVASPVMSKANAAADLCLNASAEAVLGAVTGAIMARLVGWLVPLTEDHTFDPRVATAILPDRRCAFPNPPGSDGASSNGAEVPLVAEMVLDSPCGGTGRYLMTLEWRLNG